uniref:Midkine n=1 Tax=Lates calcarifer TaxID=8187 RepID=A0A4W6EV10_LATCA
MRAVLLLLVVSLLTIKTVVGGKNKKERNKPSQYGSECTDWRYGNCVPSNGDCGAGLREGSCDQQTKKMKCKVPCNWKKDFGGTTHPHNLNTLSESALNTNNSQDSNICKGLIYSLTLNGNEDFNTIMESVLQRWKFHHTHTHTYTHTHVHRGRGREGDWTMKPEI